MVWAEYGIDSNNDGNKRGSIVAKRLAGDRKPPEKRTLALMRAIIRAVRLLIEIRMLGIFVSRISCSCRKSGGLIGC